ncbi:TolC family protein [Massilia agilis]|uniref:TolC family protein n=1 Tax=Massilia agilis TaxID=1811226 RepID=A0ABT2D9M5_9BURK|nr:TolC family protein [Massilia agilis]MCS0807986.1 TolC family protein [Massilia agilis]
MSKILLRPLAAAAALAVLSGCASVTPDGGFGQVAATTRARIGQEPRIVRTDDDKREIADTIKSMLRQPLGADDAVRIALLNNPGLQSTYWEVGIAQADLAQASRLPNPSLDFKRTRAGGDIEIERTFTVNLIGALTLPLASRLESRRFEQVRLLVGAAIERQAAETRRAWYEAVAAQQGVAYARQVNKAAEASAELSARMAQAGNASQLDLAREQAFQAEAAAAVVRAERQALGARERLTRLMGLWGENASYALPDRLPDLPAAPAELNDIERMAISQRLDIQAARAEAQATASALGLTKTTRFINVLDLGYVRNTGSDLPTSRGYEISLELPLFDWGGARVARAEAIYMQSVNRVAEAAVNARSEAREAYLGYRSSYDLARHYRDDVIPLRKKISGEVLLRYNGMLASTFELLADAREQAGAVNAYIDALKDFWVAHATLEATLGSQVGNHDMNKEHKQ